MEAVLGKTLWMDQFNSKSADAVKHQSGESSAQTLSVFAQSLIYSAVAAPARAVSQVLDHTVGSNSEAQIQSALNKIGIHQPEAAQFGTSDWTAQQLGGAIGTVFPMWLSRKVLPGKAEELVLKSASEQSVGSRFTSAALREATTSARAGFLYGAVLTPTDDRTNPSNFYSNRLSQGVRTAGTFSAMGATASYSRNILNEAASSIESSALNGVIKAPLKTALQSGLVHGAISGIPGGVINSQFDAWSQGKSHADWQQVKESVVSLTMTGGALGAAHLFEGAPGKISEISLKLSSPISEIESKPTITNPYDIKFDSIETAWKPEDVNKHMAVETRPMEVAAEGRETLIGSVPWSHFYQWGVETVPVTTNVYRFPGLKTEIVVPSEYAQSLDKVRLERLNAAENPTVDVSTSENPHRNRILPEEMAQMLRQLPHPDLVGSVQLLDTPHPWDLLDSHEDQINSKESSASPDSDKALVSWADADIEENNRIRIFESSTNDFVELQETMKHEWAHLVETNPAFKAFEDAAKAEEGGFFSRDYAREDLQENWAVHFGERFLSHDGAAFAELPEKAPARALVMARALRNTLEASADNPSSNHQVFLARVQIAEDIASEKLRAGILEDIEKGDDVALNQKLQFLNTAVRAANSPDLFSKVLGPIEAPLQKAFEARASGDQTVLETRANQMALRFDGSSTR